MAREGITLVYGGGHVGIMGILADATLAAGGRVIGIIPEHLHEFEVAHPGLSELYIVPSMHERKQLMFEKSDAFAMLPGGLGSLDETFEILTWKQLGLHDKPVVIINNAAYWQPFLDLVDHMIGAGFVRESDRQLFTVVERVDDVVDTIRSAPAPSITTDAVSKLS